MPPLSLTLASRFGIAPEVCAHLESAMHARRAEYRAAVAHHGVRRLECHAIMLRERLAARRLHHRAALATAHLAGVVDAMNAEPVRQPGAIVRLSASVPPPIGVPVLAFGVIAGHSTKPLWVEAVWTGTRWLTCLDGADGLESIAVAATHWKSLPAHPAP